MSFPSWLKATVDNAFLLLLGPDDNKAHFVHFGPEIWYQLPEQSVLTAECHESTCRAHLIEEIP
jgi:hypothetical protein